MQDYNLTLIHCSNYCFKGFHIFTLVLQDVKIPSVIVKIDRMFHTTDLHNQPVKEFVNFYQNFCNRNYGNLFKLVYARDLNSNKLNKHLHVYQQDADMFNVCDIGITDAFNAKTSNI